VPTIDWLAPIKALVALVLGQRGAAAAMRLIVDIDPKRLTVCKPTLLREGRAFIWNKRGIAHARKVRNRIVVDWTPL
jgi:hypothetical protein